MNLPGHRIAACLGKAALKTHALQTLRDRRASPNRAKRLECVRFIGAFRPARDGPRFMVPMHAKNEKRLSMNRTAGAPVSDPARCVTQPLRAGLESGPIYGLSFGTSLTN